MFNKTPNFFTNVIEGRKRCMIVLCIRAFIGTEQNLSIRQ